MVTAVLTAAHSHAGGALVNLPKDILLGIAWHFTVKEWAVGPAQASRSLYRMNLPRLVLHIRECLVSCCLPLAFQYSTSKQACWLLRCSILGILQIRVKPKETPCR